MPHWSFNTKLRGESMPGQSDSDGKRLSGVMVFLFYFCSLPRTCAKRQILCPASFGRCLNRVLNPKFKASVPGQSPAHPGWEVRPSPSWCKHLKLVPSRRQTASFWNVRWFSHLLHVHTSSSWELKVWAACHRATWLGREILSPDLKGWGEIGVRDVNLLASIPGGFNACHSSGTTNF